MDTTWTSPQFVILKIVINLLMIKETLW
jgi:hypothetical protein